MVIDKECIELVEHFEGCKLEAYLDPVGVPTVGKGTTRINGKPVELGMSITHETADLLMREELTQCGHGILDLIKVALKPYQLSALMAFVYNVGIGAFRKSTMLKYLNRNQFDYAANEFLRWNKAGGKILAGLTRRRKAEKYLFETGKNKFDWPTK